MAKTRILVVDDGANTRRLLTTCLRQEEYEPILAKDGQEALRSLSEENPALIIFDVRIPGINGFEVCCRIWASSDEPVVMLTVEIQTKTCCAGLTAELTTTSLNHAILMSC